MINDMHKIVQFYKWRGLNCHSAMQQFGQMDRASGGAVRKNERSRRNGHACRKRTEKAKDRDIFYGT